MFRAILIKAIRTVDVAGYCTKPVARRSQPEINDVKLVGTLIADAFTLPSGTKALTIKTVESPDNYQIHKVYTRGFDDLRAGERVSIFGKLTNTPFLVEDKIRNHTVISAQRIFVLENGSNDSAQYDCNHVSLVGNIAAPVLIKDNYCLLKIATHFNRVVDNVETRNTHFHAVFVNEDNLREFAKNLKLRDRIVLTGEIHHHTHTDADGKKKYSGFVVSKTLEKIKRKEKNAEENAPIEATN